MEFATADSAEYTSFMYSQQPPWIFTLLELEARFRNVPASSKHTNFLFCCLRFGVRCVTISELTFSARGVTGFCWMFRNPVTKIPAKPPSVSKRQTEVTANAASSFKPTLCDLREALASVDWLSHDQHKNSLALYALGIMMRSIRDCDYLLCRLAVATLFLQARLPLRLRVQPAPLLTHDWQLRVCTFEESFYVHSLRLLLERQHPASSPPMRLHDFFDAHLFRVILARELDPKAPSRAASLGIPAAFIASLETVWNYLTRSFLDKETLSASPPTWDKAFPNVPLSPEGSPTPVITIAPAPPKPIVKLQSKRKEGQVEDWEELDDAPFEETFETSIVAENPAMPRLLPVNHPLINALGVLKELPVYQLDSLPPHTKHVSKSYYWCFFFFFLTCFP